MGLTSSIEERYYLQKVKLGDGRFGSVWRAVDRQHERVVAVRQLKKARLARAKVQRSDLEREVSLMRSVSHGNVAQCFDMVEEHGDYFMVVEHAADGDLAEKLQERGALTTEEEVISWMRQICSGLAALHEKDICHRDVKPENFMVHGDVLKLKDFALAVQLPRGRLLRDKCGSPPFMAPEQHTLPRYSDGYNHMCDIWAAGVLMYMLMSEGRHPFTTDSKTTGCEKDLDMGRLLQGSLDFSSGLFGVLSGTRTHRFGEAARVMCQRMVEKRPKDRVTAQAALQEEWFNPWVFSEDAIPVHKDGTIRACTDSASGCCKDKEACSMSIWSRFGCCRSRCDIASRDTDGVEIFQDGVEIFQEGPVARSARPVMRFPVALRVEECVPGAEVRLH